LFVLLRVRGGTVGLMLTCAMMLTMRTTLALQTPTLTLPGTLDQMPIVGYGTWLAAAGDVYQGTKAAIAQGYRHIDEAWIYENEREVGQAIKEALAEGTIKSRDDLWITSKLWQCYHRPELVREGCLDSMAQLGVDVLDLYLIHFPIAFVPGCKEAVSENQMEDVPIGDTWRAMEKLVDEGLVKNIGVSNFEVDDLKAVQAVATKPIAVNQFETHPFYQRHELLDYCQSHGIVVTAHSSMGGGANAMKAFHASPPLTEEPVLLEIARKHATTVQAVLLAWGVQRPTAVVPKSISPTRIAANLEATLAVTLDTDDLVAIAALDKPGLEGCYCHPKTPWLGRSEFTGSTDHYYG